MDVHLLREPEPASLEFLRSKLDQGVDLSLGDINQSSRETRVLVAGRPTPEELDALPGLRALIVPWTGIPTQTLDAVRGRSGLSLHNLHHNAAPTAELALALLLTAAKLILPHDRDLREGDWRRRYQAPESTLLAGRQALILGYGAIGRRIDRALQGLDVRVCVVRRSPERDSGREFSVDDLPDLLPETDFLVLALPLTAETAGLIGEKELELLPETALIVNVARGEIIQQGPLFRALKEGWIAGAGLDVWYCYPGDEKARSATFPGDYPFQELENVVLSPHRAGLVRETEILRMEALASLLNQAARGLPMDNQVDPELGY